MWGKAWRLLGEKLRRRPGHVGRAEYESARARLRKRAGFDLDAFLRTTDARSLFAEPLGPTQSCLSISEVSAVAQGKEEELGAEHAKTVKLHLITCDNCRNTIRMYNDMQARDWLERDPLNEPRPFFILSSAPVFLDFARRAAEITIGTYLSPGHKELEIDPRSVSISGFIEASTCTIVESWLEGPDHRKLFRARVEGNLSLVDRSPREVCDWLEIRGKTTLGQRFHARSLMHFKLM